MTAPVAASERDVRALAAIISEDRPDVLAKGGLPPSLLAELMGQIRCDVPDQPVLAANAPYSSRKIPQIADRAPTPGPATAPAAANHTRAVYSSTVSAP